VDCYPSKVLHDAFASCVFDDERLDLLKRFIMNPTKENPSSMLEKLEVVPEPGEEDPGQRAAAKGKSGGVNHCVVWDGEGDEEIENLQNWVERGRED
jgi:hypothetical protein